MKHAPLIKSLYQIGCIQFGEFKLKSGQTSSIYINLRKIISYPKVLKEMASLMWQQVHDCQFDLICGVPYTALPIATCLSLEHGIPMVMRRKEKKDYGTKQMIEGVFTDNQRCIIIEDLVTTGSSILETAKDLENEKLIITDVVAFLDREQGGKATLEKQYRLHTITTLSGLLDILLKSNLLNSTERHLIERFLQERASV